MMTDSLKIVSLNVRGLAETSKRREVLKWLESKHSKIILLQETHSSIDTEPFWRAEWQGMLYFSHGTSNSRGTCILIHRSVPHTVHRVIPDPNGRFLILDIDIYNIRLTLCNVYGPNVDDPTFYIELIREIEALPNDYRIIGGDFNLVLDLNLDKMGGRNITNRKSQILIQNWMDDSDLLDIWRFHHPDSRLYTWHRKNPSKVFCRLDFFIISFGLAEKVESSSIEYGYRTDHSLISINFIPNDNKRGKGLWKLNCSLLRDIDYINLIKNTINRCKEINHEANPNLLWDTIKMSVRGESIKYGTRKKKIMNTEILRLENRIKELELQISSNNNVSELLEEIQLNKISLANVIKVKTQGAIIRSRAQWYEEGEINSKYFFGLEKRTSSIKSINRLELSNGSISQNSDVILEEMKRYYETLYTSVKINDSQFPSLPQPPKPISQNNIDVMDKELTEEELLKVIKSLPNNKTPGEDGLPAEFYKLFWINIKSLLLASYRFSLQQGSLSITQRRGVLCLIPKKSDPLKLKNWRPISLLNQDYKILTKAIAERLKPSLHEIINHNQSGFLKGRYIGQNIVNILDVLYYTEQNEIPGVLISIDFEKAFDKLEWSFIYKCLTYFQFPEKIKFWISTLYNNIQSCVTNNGWQSDYFTLQRGVRQGCPLSPYLFILCSEILALQIRENNNIHGICIGNKTYKVNQYADDTQIFSQFDEVSINEIIQTFNEFTQASGLLINYDKTEVLRLGAVRNTNVKLQTYPELKWTNEQIQILGIIVTTNLTKLNELNFDPIITKMNNIIKIWSRRKLTLMGKVTIIKSLLESQLIYRLSVLPSPQTEYLKKIDKILFDYLWNNKPHKISKDVITQSRQNAGLSMTDIVLKNRALKIAWIKRIIDDSENIISPILNYYCKVDLKYLLECNLSPEDSKCCWAKHPSQFWSDVIYHWCCFNYSRSETITDIQQPLLLNSNIKINNKVIFFKELYEKKILYIKDLMDEEKNFYSYEVFQSRYSTKLTFLHYYGIIKATKLVIKSNPSTVDKPPSSSLKKLTEMKSVSKEIYITLLNKREMYPSKAYTKIKRHLNLDISKDTFLVLFNNIYITTSSTKLREFQYRLLNSAIVTNQNLMKWGIKDHDRCSFCNSETETTFHLLIKCSVSKTIWSNIFGNIQNTCDLHVQLTDEEIYLGLLNPELRLLNLVTLVVKQYLYACRCRLTKPIWKIALTKIKEVRDIEHKVAVKNNHLEKFTKKWDLLANI